MRHRSFSGDRGEVRRHIPLTNLMPVDIMFRALFTITRARLCSAIGARVCFFFLSVVPRACRLRTTPLAYYCRERQRGMCLGSVGSGLDPGQPHRWLESRSFSGYLVQFCPRASPPFSSAPTTPPFADEDTSPCKQGRGKNMPVCARGMHKTGVNTPLKRC